MFSFSEVIYYILFSTTLILSFKASNENLRGLIFLRILLVVGLISELIVDVLDYYTYYSKVPYYIYIPFEFTTLFMFFGNTSSHNLLKMASFYAIPIYLTFAIYFSIVHYSLSDYPGIIYNIGCIFVILLTVILLFNLEMKSNLRLTQLPIFWICTGIVIFYSGVFFYNAVYNYLLMERTELAKKLRLLINMNLNYALYLIWSFAFICSIRLKKFFIP